MNILYIMFWQDEEYWHWTHDIEVLKVIIPFFGTLFTGIITLAGILFAAKTTHDSLSNLKESTPPELLRLATWSTIIHESQEYQDSMSNYYSNRLMTTYYEILIRATLEKNILDLGVTDPEVRKELLVMKPKSISKEYPRIVWSIRSNKNLLKYVTVLTVLFITLLTFAIINLQNNNIYFTIIVATILLFISLGIIKVFYTHNRSKIIKNIIFRNACHALEDIYKIPGGRLREDFDSCSERKNFENIKEYKKWKDRIQDGEPKRRVWTSWNYGLSVNWDNNPYKGSVNKDTTRDLEPNHLPPSLFQSKDTAYSNNTPKFSDAKLPPQGGDK